MTSPFCLFPSPIIGVPYHRPSRGICKPRTRPPGKFTMGSPASEPFHKADENPETQVTLTRGFWLSRTIVTIGQWKSVTGLDVRAQLAKMLHDDTLYDLGGKMQTVHDFMRFSRNADPGQY